jgi:hypothetical protein
LDYAAGGIADQARATNAEDAVAYVISGKLVDG